MMETAASNFIAPFILQELIMALAEEPVVNSIRSRNYSRACF